MSGPRVVGIDLSLTSTGLADNRGRTERVRTKPATTVPGTVRRLLDITEAVRGFADIWASLDIQDDADLVVIEGPSYGSTTGQQHTRGGLWWLVVSSLRDFPILVVPPTTRAMYATGKGNAGKDEVLTSAIRRYPAYDITGNDVADAVVLAAIGARMLGHPIDDLPKTHLRALDKLTLPEGTTP